MASDISRPLSPDSVDTLTELASILSRLRPSPSTTNLSTPALANLAGPTGTAPTAAGATTTGATPAPHPGAVTGTTPLPAPGHPSTVASTAARASGAATSDTTNGSTPPPGGFLALKDVPTATDGLKHKLQRARAQIRQFPDMDRTVAQQEAEAAELEARIARQRKVLAALREVGMRFARSGAAEEGGVGNGGDVVMQG